MTSDLASTQQVRYFFALSKDVGLDADVAKEKAKAKFNLDSFSSITSQQIRILIDLLKQRSEDKWTKHEHSFEVEARAVDRIYYRCQTCPAIMIEFRPEQE